MPDDDHFGPPPDMFVNEAGNLHILVATDGESYRVLGGGRLALAYPTGILAGQRVPVGGLRGPAAVVDAPVGRPPDDEIAEPSTDRCVVRSFGGSA